MKWTCAVGKICNANSPLPERDDLEGDYPLIFTILMIMVHRWRLLLLTLKIVEDLPEEKKSFHC